MHQYKGKLIIHTGSMFSGKTSSLEKEIKRFAIAGYKTIAFKPSIDTRTTKEDIITHDNISLKAIRVNNMMEIKKYIENNEVDVIGIDEIQFFQDDVRYMVEQINNLLYLGKTIVVAGLDMDFSATPFEIIKELMPRADYLNKHHAVCTRCGSDAWISKRKTKSDKRIVIGAAEEYEPLCRHCYNIETK